MPDEEGLRAGILQECRHRDDRPLGGHFGRHKTVTLVRRLTHWQDQTRDVDN
jgi:hypothetical protein